MFAVFRYLDVLLNPIDVSCHLSVNTRVTIVGTSHTPADNTALDGLFIAHEWAAGITLAGVDTQLSSTDHVSLNNAAVVGIVFITDCNRE